MGLPPWRAGRRRREHVAGFRVGYLHVRQDTASSPSAPSPPPLRASGRGYRFLLLSCRRVSALGLGVVWELGLAAGSGLLAVCCRGVARFAGAITGFGGSRSAGGELFAGCSVLLPACGKGLEGVASYFLAACGGGLLRVGSQI